MADYSISISQVPIGGRAVLNIETTDTGALSDVDSVQVIWRDHEGNILSDLTRTVADVSGVDSHGEPVDIVDIPGTGTYSARLVISSDFSPSIPLNGNLRFSAEVVIVKGAKTQTATFYAYIVATTLAISLESSSIATAVMRQTNVLRDFSYSANGAVSNIPLNAGIIYAIHEAYKNGVAIARPTDYTWATFRGYVGLVAPAALGDTYVFRIQTKSDAWVQDIVQRHIQEVIRDLAPHYDSTVESFLQSPSVIDLVKSLCIGEMKQMLVEGVALESAHYRSGADLARQARQQVLRIQRGESDIYDTAGAAIPRKAGTIAGGYLAPNGAFAQRLAFREAHPPTDLYVGLVYGPWWFGREALWQG